MTIGIDIIFTKFNKLLCCFFLIYVYPKVITEANLSKEKSDNFFAMFKSNKHPLPMYFYTLLHINKSSKIGINCILDGVPLVVVSL